MKTTVMLFATALSIAVGGTGCGHSSRQTIQDQQSVQGHWNGYSSRRPDDKCTVEIAGNRFEYRGAGSNNWSRGTFVLRGNVAPKEMDLTVLEPADQANQKLLAIYEFDGDSMTVAMSSSQRPVSFTADSQAEVFHCKRQ